MWTKCICCCEYLALVNKHQSCACSNTYCLKAAKCLKQLPTSYFPNQGYTQTLQQIDFAKSLENALPLNDHGM